MRHLVMPLLLLAPSAMAADKPPAQPTAGQISIRTETFPRPPYSGATYYIYEQGGDVICTKLEVCNKYDQCSTEYARGRYKSDEDVATGDPYGTTAPVVIPMAKLHKHVCLVRHKLVAKG